MVATVGQETYRGLKEPADPFFGKGLERPARLPAGQQASPPRK